MIISKREHQEKLELGKPLESLINDLTTCPLPELPGRLHPQLDWQRPRGDLFHWISVLNRFDDVFEHQIAKYTIDGDKTTLCVMSDEDQTLVRACLNFTTTLLNHSSNRVIYNSKERVFAFFNTPTLSIRLAALEVAVSLSEVYSQSSSKMTISKEVKKKVLQMIHSYPPLVPAKFQTRQTPAEQGTSSAENRLIGDHFSFIESLNQSAKYPDQWKSINFPYYKTHLKPKVHETLCHFHIHAETVKKLTIEQIFDKASESIPASNWFEFSLHAYVAKGFNTKGHDSIHLREQLIQCKLYALSFICNTSTEDYVSSRVFESEPYIFTFLADMISPQAMDMLSDDVYFSALKTLCCISSKLSWSGELIRCLGANVNHGVLYQGLRTIYKRLSTQDPRKFEKGYIYLFNLVGNLIQSPSLASRVASGGILKELMEFLKEPHRFWWHASASAHLLTVFLTHSTGSIDEFIANNGFQLIIETLGKEVDLALSSPPDPPKDSVVHYTINFRQANFIRYFMKLVTFLIQSDSGDRLRNLFDSPILQSFNKIFENPTVFGPSILSDTIDSVFYIIHNEPTAFSILNEANVIDSILNNYETFFLPDGDLLLELPEILGAIALNKEGLKKVEEKKSFESFFKVFRNPVLCKQLTKRDAGVTLGGSFDELGRHYNSFKPIIIQQIQSLIKEIPPLVNERIDGLKFFTSDEDGLELVHWEVSEYGYVFDATVGFLRSMLIEASWNTQILKEIEFSDMLNFLDVPNAPYDVASDNYSLTDLFSYFNDEEEDKNNNFPIFCDFVRKKLTAPLINQFLNSPDNNSFFNQVSADPPTCTRFLRELNGVTIALVGMCVGSFGWGVMGHERYRRLAEIFGSEDGLDFLTRIAKLLKKVILEETFMRANVAKEVLIETTPSADRSIENPKIRVLTEIPVEDKKPNYELRKTHAYKNVLQMRSFCFQIIHSASDTFSYLGKIGMHRRQDFHQIDIRRNVVKITVKLGELINDMCKIYYTNLPNKEGYMFVLSRIIWYMVHQEDRGKKIIQTSLMIGLLQSGAIATLRDVCIDLWDPELSLSEDLKTDHQSAIIDTPESVRYHTLHSLLTMFYGINDETSYPGIPSPGFFFASKGLEIASETVAYVRNVSSVLVNECLEQPLESRDTNGPTELVKLMVSICRQVFETETDTDNKEHEFFPYDWKNVLPPFDQVEYLKDLGMSEANVLHYYKHTGARDFNPLFEKRWTPPSAMTEEELEAIRMRIFEDKKSLDLDFSIKFRNSGLIVSDFFPVFFKIVKIYPELSESVAALLVKGGDEALFYISGILARINDQSMSRNETSSFVQSGMSLAKSLLNASLKTAGYFVKPDKVEIYRQVFVLVVTELSRDINCINDQFMAPGLEIISQILSFQDTNKAEECIHASIQSIVNTEVVVDGIADQEMIEKLFQLLVSVETLENKHSISGIISILVLLTKKEVYRAAVSQSNVIRILVAKSFLFAHDSNEENQASQRALVVLIRRCFEDEDVVKANINSEFNSILSHRMKRELPLFLKDCSNLALRSPEVFTELASEKIRLGNYDGKSLYPTQMSIVVEQTSEGGVGEKTESTENTDNIETEETEKIENTEVEKHNISSASAATSSIINSVVSELIIATKKDIFSTPSGFKPSDKKNKKLTEIFYNKDFTYACYLLQILIELLGSYMKCKLEFITYSKKETTEVKPRSTALNVLIHQIIPTQQLVSNTGIESDRKSSISSLAKLAILALMSTPVLDLTNNPDPKKENPDMAFVRKFCTDLIIKSMRDTVTSNQPISVRYSKLIDIFDLQGSLLSSKFRQVTGPLLNKQATKCDAFYIARSFIDNQIATHIATLISGFDLNFPDISKVIKSSIYPLNLLGKLKTEYQENFEEDRDEKDDELPEIDDKDDDAPDLFKNSTLGMYDIEYETEDEYYDEELDDLMPEMSDGEEEEDDGSDQDSDSDDSSEEDSDGSDMEVESESEGEDTSMAGSYLQAEEESSEYDSDDVEIIDTTAVGVDESDGSEFYFDDGYEEDEMTSEYDESELEGWIQDFMDSEGEAEGEGEDEGEDEHRERHTHQGINIGAGVAVPGLRAVVDDNFINTFASDETDGESINEEEFDGIGISNSNRRRASAAAGGVVNSIFDALRPTFNRNMVDAVSVIFNGDTNTAERMVRIINDGSNSVSRFDNAIGSMFEWGNGGGRNTTSAADTLSNLYIKSTLERWTDSVPEYQRKHKDRIVSNLIPGIVNRISEPSIQLEVQRQEKLAQVMKERDEKRRKREEEEKKKEEEAAIARQQERERRAEAEAEAEAEADSSRADLDPIMVRIGEREVDISGTDIDPEFFEALPDDMREEVFTQHIRERRANARRGSTHDASREIDPDFLDALPDQIRDEILQQESMARYSYMRNEDEEDDDEVMSEEEEEERAHTHTHDDVGEEEEDKKKAKKVFFTPLVDKTGIAAIIRLLFVPQTINKRDSIHQAMKYLCYNKQTRVEVVNLLVSILHEALISEKSLDKIFYHLTIKGQKTTDGKEGKDSKEELEGNTTLPSNSSPIIVADQIIDLLLFLLENNNQLRYFFLTEHENPYIMKKKKFKTKQGLNKSEKYQINILLKLLENKLLREDQPFMDLLSRILQLATKPLSLLKKHKQSDKPIPLNPPVIPDHLLSQMVKFLTSNDCPNTTFRRAISAMQNLTSLDNAQVIFSLELSDRATALGQAIINDLNSLTDELRQGNHDTDNKYFSRFNASSSDQAKLLRVLTALDYMFEFKEESQKTGDDVEELTGLYKRLALGSLWDALSDCLKVLEDGELSKIATILLPLIEALMVVCKHSKVKELGVKDAVKYQAKKVDFTKEPIENLFFSFTDEHKKILNQMVRTNPNLMSGPFGMLVRNPKVLEFDNKKNYFDRRLHDKKDDKKALAINVRRDQVFLDSYRALFFKSKEEFRDSKLDVNFKGEAGIDAGGVTREWYQVLSRQMFNPDYALFTPVSSDANTYHPNRTSYINPEHLSFFKFIGKIIGKAIYDNCFLDCHFSRAVYKRILGRKVSIKDMETLDLEYFKSLLWMLENDITDVITEDFSVETDDYGEKKIIDFIPDGRNIPVTELNKQDYVRAVVEYRLQTSVADQMDNFLIGFHEIIPKDLVSIFDEQELELLVSGLPDIDVQDWQNNSSYNNYSPSSIQIQWFWRAVKSFDNEERAKLLQFATGTSKVPLNGFKELSGANGSCKFSIHRDYGSLERLPSSHTCFNQIDLPAYETYETLRGSLLLAITEGHEGFGLA